MSMEDLKKQEDALRKQLLDKRFELKGGRLLDTASIRKTRRELARVLTAMRQNNG